MLRLWRAREGAASILTALSGMALIGMAALGVDLGAVYLKSRALQGVADLAALSAAEDLASAQRRAELTVGANPFGAPVAVATELGGYEADPDVAPGARFQTSASEANAVRVTLTADAPLYFGAVFVPSGAITLRRQATAAQARLASFQIGSRLLAVRGGVANALLSGLTGSTVSLSVMDYNALIDADVDLLAYAEALRTRLDLQAASYDEVLAADLEAPLALDALADALVLQGDSTAARAMRILARATRDQPLDGLDALIDLGPYGAQDVLAGPAGVEVSAYDLATAVLQLANGERQVALDLGVAAPGLARVRAWLAIGERPNNSPWLTVTASGAPIIRTAQMRLYLEADVGLSGLSGVASVRIPLLVEAASAQARLADIDCGASAAAHRVTLAVAPSLGMIALAEIDRAQLNNFRRTLALRPAPLVRTALIRADGYSRIDLGGQRWQDVTFRGDEIDRGVVKTVQTRDIAQATITSLIGELDLDVRIAGLGLGLTNNAVTAALARTLGAAAAPLDTVVNALTDLLGVHLGEADLRVNGVRCSGAALVG